MGEERIVLIEDDSAVAKGLSFALEQEGYVVLCGEDGRTGYGLVAKQAPHLIILDIRLPDTSGFDLCRRLRQEGYRQPILMLTARDEEVDKVLGFELGADDYVVKPYQLRELLSRVRALLRRAYGELAQRSSNEKIVFDDVTLDLGTAAGVPRRRNRLPHADRVPPVALSDLAPGPAGNARPDPRSGVGVSRRGGLRSHRRRPHAPPARETGAGSPPTRAASSPCAATATSSPPGRRSSVARAANLAGGRRPRYLTLWGS